MKGAGVADDKAIGETRFRETKRDCGERWRENGRDGDR